MFILTIDKCALLTETVHPFNLLNLFFIIFVPLKIFFSALNSFPASRKATVEYSNLNPKIRRMKTIDKHVFKI